MKRKRKLALVARATNWTASVPGTIEDWKDIGKKAVKLIPAISPVPLWWSQGRGWIMGSWWGEAWVQITVVMLLQLFGLLLFVWLVGRAGRREALRERERAAFATITKAVHWIGDPEWVHPGRCGQDHRTRGGDAGGGVHENPSRRGSECRRRCHRGSLTARPVAGCWSVGTEPVSAARQGPSPDFSHSHR